MEAGGVSTGSRAEWANSRVVQPKLLCKRTYIVKQSKVTVNGGVLSLRHTLFVRVCSRCLVLRVLGTCLVSFAVPG
jgi:hypothetical protein